ncbi:Reticulon-like protein B17 [Cardamine amara subsp. amara]|uniref:Reticulon-like protein n=1 Tax=Cardamine amara subsp. amara TaxID=228776 RepID=A0ABD1BQA6_CARAN
MDSTPPYHRSNTKSASRLPRVNNSLDDSNQEPQKLCLDLVLSSPKSNDTLSLRSSSSSVPLREILLLSPSPHRKSKTRLADRLEMASEDAADPAVVVRKRGRPKGGQKGLLASPRNPRRSRRRSEAVEEKEANVVIEEIVKPRKRKTNGRPKKDKANSAPLLPPPCSSSDLPSEDVCQSDLNRIGEIISDLVMWRDVAKSTLWFGFGCLCFLSSCFAKGVNFSIFSAVSNLGLVLLCGSFLSNTFCQRKSEETKRVFHLSEDDILRLARRVLPATNFAISKTSELFSGEPSMTLKVTPFLLIGAEYGHLITLWRLSAFGFFLSFTIPKLYSCYTHQISQKAERVKMRIGEAWGACSHKKVLAGSAVTAFWNLTSLRTRIFAVFIILVVIRYRRQNLQLNPEEVEPVEIEKQEEEILPQEEEQTQPQEQQALVMVVAEIEGSKTV